MALAGGVLITDQITDHFAPYCYELRTAAINKIRVLADADGERGVDIPPPPP